jgi:hypothetical protein
MATTHPRRVHLAVLANRLDDARQIVMQEFQGVAQAVASMDSILLARIAAAATPTTLAAFGLSGVVTEQQWQALLSIKSRIPAAWNSSFQAAQGATAEHPEHPDFWTWVAGLGFVPLQENDV